MALGPALFAQTAGQADVAFQGYYMAGSGQPLTDTSGLAVSTSEFIAGVGLFNADFEGYGGNGFRSGNVFAGLEKVPIWGWHWDFLGGDFHFSSNLVQNPFVNIYTPEIAGRGLQIAMRRKDCSYQFFVGEETLLEGPRIPFRFLMPQRVLGISMQQKVGERWEFGVRYLDLSTSPSALTSEPSFFLPGHEFRNSNSLTFQSSYSFTKHLKFYTEAGYGTASSFTPAEEGSASTPVPVGQQPISVLVGPSWEEDKFSLKANYVRQSTTYLPLLGYFVGDRKGPYVEGHYRAVKRLDFYASASAYSNNLENNPDLPTFHSSAYTAGASVVLPWKFSASASLSTADLRVREPSQLGESPSNNHQTTFNLNRPIRRHSLRLTLIDMKLNTTPLPQTQRFTEVEDIFTWKRFVLGGSVRMQNSHSTESRNTLFFRGSLQANFRRLSVYGYVEKGNDLVNRSIFSTNAYNTSVAGLSAPLIRGWNLQFEAFRNTLNTALNPENVFLFPTSGLGMNTQLAAFNQWSVFARVSKRFHWGKELPRGGDIEQYAAAHAPLVGSVQGLVMEQSLNGSHPAAGVAITLAHFRTAFTDASGHYQFSAVAEGIYDVGLDMEQLPTDYEPGPANKAHVKVEPRAIARADFSVVRLTYLTGRVVAPAGTRLENAVIRLAGTNRYTTPYQDGSFAFYNLREGEYEMVFDEQTLPEGYLLASPARVRVLASSTNPPAGEIEFELKLEPVPEKPVREILQEEIHMGVGGGAARRGSHGGSGGGGHGGGHGGGTFTLTAEPSTVEKGHSVTLSWTSQNATELILEPTVGKVQAQGSTTVTPQESTTYTFTATGPGGSQTATARVTVMVPPPPPPPKVEVRVEDLFEQNMKDAYFDFDKSDIRPDAQRALTSDAEFLKAHPDIKFTIETHCDERGGEEYNRGLGDRRATSAKTFLVNLGISADRINTISYGKGRPVCTDHNEVCWQKNRRAHFHFGTETK
jgi:peptidoglycan-associated lipoprotein